MKELYFIHSLPISFFPKPGERMVLAGLAQQDLAKLAQEAKAVSYIRYPDTEAKACADAGVQLLHMDGNCPSPQQAPEAEFIVVTLAPGSTEVSYTRLFRE